MLLYFHSKSTVYAVSFKKKLKCGNPRGDRIKILLTPKKHGKTIRCLFPWRFSEKFCHLRVVCSQRTHLFTTQQHINSVCTSSNVHLASWDYSSLLRFVIIHSYEQTFERYLKSTIYISLS